MAGSEDLAVGDPLLMQGLEKRSARIQVNGPFVQVLGFLRSLEKLEVCRYRRFVGDGSAFG